MVRGSLLRQDSNVGNATYTRLDPIKTKDFLASHMIFYIQPLDNDI